jgi:RNA polymerase sigma-70 factor (ECF subfamily)
MTTGQRDGTLDLDVSTSLQLKDEGLTDAISAAQDARAAAAVHYDAQLMKRIESGSTEAFEELYDRYSPRAYGVAWWVCHEHGRAEEAVQEAFMSIWRSRTGYTPGRGTVAAWLLTTVRYRAIDVVRRNTKHADRRSDQHLLDTHPAAGDIAEQTANRDEAHRLHGLLTTLPDTQREVVTLAYFGQMSHTEIATALDLPTGTIKGRMRLGLQKLRAGIEKEAA